MKMTGSNVFNKITSKVMGDLKIKLIKLSVFLLAIASIYSLVSCERKQKNINNNNVLVVGTNAEFAPFCFIEDGDIKGFDIDMAKEVCNRIGKELKIKDMSFEALIPEVTMQSVDFIAAGMTISDERKKVVNFSIPYLSGDPLVVVYDKTKYSKEQVKQENFNKLKVVVNEGYTADFYVSDNFEFEPIRLNNPIDGFMALAAARGDIFISSRSSVLALLEKNKNLTYNLLGGQNENCALIIAKKNGALLSQINKAIEEMIEEGIVETLKKKWGL